MEEGRMSAVLTLGGTGYGKLFMGTGEEAAAAGEDSYIPFVEDGTGAYTYEVPVEVLNRAGGLRGMEHTQGAVVRP